MDINKICTKIKELGHINSKREELREYCKLKFDQVQQFTSTYITVILFVTWFRISFSFLDS